MNDSKEAIKLIVEIPKSDYNAICANKEDAIIAHDTCRRIANNSTPLSNVLAKLKTEIENRSYGIANDSVIQGEMYERRAVLEIIDNIESKE